MTTHLPVVEKETGSLRKDGSRNWIHPADVTGRFTALRRIGFAILVAVYVVMPWINVGGHPAVFLDIAHRKFYLFGFTFNAQDAWLAFFLITGMGFLLLVMTAVLGRAWCGYACPQTVFLEGFFRRIERLIEGPRNSRIRRNAGPMTLDKLWRKSLKHLVFVVLAVAIAHVFLSYFVSLPALFEMVQRDPAEHPEAFGWVVGVSLATYGNFAFFREQFCLIVCPYGRLQSVLTDKDSIIVGYDKSRGEPRGKRSDDEAGDCVDCNRCVVVCPTGIDIRNGLQLDCIGCANCVDACDEIMGKLGRDKGLVRYDSLTGLEGEPRVFLRPRLFLYAALGVVGIVITSLSVQQRTTFEANLLRLQSEPFVVEDGTVRNSLEIHLVNKASEAATFQIEPVPGDGLEYVVAVPEVTLDSLDGTHVPVFVMLPRSEMREGLRARVEVRMVGVDEEPQRVDTAFLGPEN